MSVSLLQPCFKRSFYEAAWPCCIHRLYATAVARPIPKSEPALPPDLSSAEDPLAGQKPKSLKRKTNAIKEAKLRRPNLLERSKVQDHLNYVAATKDDLVLKDIERCKPKEHGQPGTAQYETDYNRLFNDLVTSFNVKQLRAFLRLYKLQLPGRLAKKHLATAIIERQWGWPSLVAIQKTQRDWSEVDTKSMPFLVSEIQV